MEVRLRGRGGEGIQRGQRRGRGGKGRGWRGEEGGEGRGGEKRGWVGRGREEIIRGRTLIIRNGCIAVM